MQLPLLLKVRVGKKKARYGGGVTTSPKQGRHRSHTVPPDLFLDRGFRGAGQVRTPVMFTLTVKATCTACGKGPVKHKVTLTKCGAILHPAKCYRCGHKWG